MGQTSIEWTERTWNPVTGCSKVSQGCKNCYAEGIADRFFAKQYPPNADGALRKFTDVRCHEDRLLQPLHWKKPSRVFVNSMSDLFHEEVPFGFIERIFEVMKACPQHTFQILTKRPSRMLKFAEFVVKHVPGFKLPLPNMWLGVSVEDQKTADERIPLLLQTPAAVRWVSYEPALGPVDFRNLRTGTFDALTGRDFELIDDRPDTTSRLDWVVCGGESGPGARPFDLEWARDVKDQCMLAGVPFFMKQMGANVFDSSLTASGRSETIHYRDRKGGAIGEWPIGLQVREWPFPCVHAGDDAWG